VLAVWIGADDADGGAFDAAGIPAYETEVDAVRGFSELVRYGEVRDALMETPPSRPEHFSPDVAAARAPVETAVREGRRWLDPLEAAAVMAAYAIPAVPTVLARDADEAAAAARPFLAAGTPVVIKIMSRDIVHKSDIGGVRLNLTSEDAVRAAVTETIARAHAAVPDARIQGVTVQPMIVRPKAHELIVGIADDPTFGPVIAFGAGGTAVEVLDDKALALPPLDLKMANELIGRTRISRILRGYRDVPPVKLADVALTLVKLAQLAADVPEVRGLDINPLLADQSGVLALDVRIAVAPLEAEPKFKGPGYNRFAVRPYPKEWELHVPLHDGTTAFVRPVRPEDEEMLRAFLGQITAEDLRLRFFAPVRHFSHAFLSRLTQLDYARAMAFVALDETTGQPMGVVRLHADSNYENAEYAVLVRSDLKGHGIGWMLMELIIRYGRSENLARIEGQVLQENTTMLDMCRQLGFEIHDDPSDRSLRLATLTLRR
jgi:acetyltransferase